MHRFFSNPETLLRLRRGLWATTLVGTPSGSPSAFPRANVEFGKHWSLSALA
jgi:hypothetical protein